MNRLNSIKPAVSRRTLLLIGAIVYPCAFSFFNVRSYLIMVLMIGGGILLRRLDVIEKEHLNTFFVTMGIPLLISAGRFYYAWATDAPA